MPRLSWGWMYEDETRRVVSVVTGHELGRAGLDLEAASKPFDKFPEGRLLLFSVVLPRMLN